MDVAHIGIVVRDLDTSIAAYEKRLGLGPWTYFDIPSGVMVDHVFEGRETNYEIRAAVADVGNIKFELIQPVGEEESPFSRFLAEHGEGMHHILLDRSAEGDERSPEKQLDLPLMMSGSLAPTLDCAYLDGRDELGLIIETARGEIDFELLPNYEVR
jgi:methylmalonyl-CoA/ethylmalonyl-CoA epimerase